MVDPLDYDGRVAIVTGGGRGLGRAHALLLASRGARVVVNDLGSALDGSGQSSGPADEVVGEILGTGGQAVADYHDISTVDGGAALVDAAVSAYGRVDVVVNNAGILRDKSVVNLEPDLWDAVIAVHLRGAYCVTRPAWSHMREQGYGRIVSTSSDAGLFGNFGQLNYGSAKMGLVGFTRVLAVEGAKHGITANAIAPVGLTRMTESLIDKSPDLPPPDPRQVASVVAWLAHEECALTGEILSIRRGRVARIVIGMGKGYQNPDLTPEDVRDHLDEIMSTDDMSTPGPGGR